MKRKIFKRMFIMGLLMLSVLSSCKKIEKEGIFAEFNTTLGKFTCEIYYDKVPIIAGNIIGLAEGSIEFTDVKTNEKVKRPFYDGLIFHRIIKDFVIQGGCPLGVGNGGPGYQVMDQFDNSLKHSEAGILSMANSGPNTNGSQFFITLAPTPHLDGKHVVFGKVIDGMDVVMKIGDVKTDPKSNKPFENVVMRSVKIIRNGEKAKAFNPAEELKKEEEIKERQLSNLLDKLGVEQTKIVTDETTGLKYFVSKEGNGRKPTAGEKIKAHYTGYFTNGSVFDSSVQRGEPIEFVVGKKNVIEGWDIALLDMKLGEKRVLVIPYYLAYGERGYPGVIPPKSTLIFDVELVGLGK